jgi:hypothetical protein
MRQRCCLFWRRRYRCEKDKWRALPINKASLQVKINYKQKFLTQHFVQILSFLKKRREIIQESSSSSKWNGWSKKIKKSRWVFIKINWGYVNFYSLSAPLLAIAIEFWKFRFLIIAIDYATLLALERKKKKTSFCISSRIFGPPFLILPFILIIDSF